MYRPETILHEEEVKELWIFWAKEKSVTMETRLPAFKDRQEYDE